MGIGIAAADGDGVGGCTALTLRGLTFDGNSQSVELVYLLACKRARIADCTFQNALTNFSLQMTGGTDNRIEGNYFGLGGGASIGYIASVGQHEEGTHVTGNRFVGTGHIAADNRRATSQRRVTSPRSSPCLRQLLITYDNACLACLGESMTTAW